MIPSIFLALSAFSLAFTQAEQAPYEKKHAACVEKSVRKSWTDLTATEKQNYIDADLCLMSLPAKAEIPGATSRWDELQYAHAAQVRYIHGVGAFLPFHRYFVAVHDHLIREECDYKGPLPYWDEPSDVGAIGSSSLFSGTPSFGGNGTGKLNCIADGPFKDVVLHFKEDLSTTETCISRMLNDFSFAAAAQENIDDCLAQKTYEDVWRCIEGKPHSAGHGGVLGTMINVMLSPGDPVFYLHHGYLDRVWYEWQSRNLSTRLTEISGGNTPSFSFPPGFNTSFPPGGPPFGGGNGSAPPFGGGAGGGGFNISMPGPDPRFEDYFFDGGNVTTLNHTLWSAGILENVTIADVMDPEGGFVCADFRIPASEA
ncbi:Di-copper centre-containing protein [Nemania sp. FL0916]|nr:Di-copper centre-containing protein [Nemania sp. FL0916]